MLKLLDKNIEYTKADIAGIVLVSVIWGERLLDFVQSVLLRIPIVRIIAKPFVMVVVVSVIIFTFKYVKNRIKASDVIFVLAILSLYLIHMAAFPANYSFLLRKRPDYFFTILPFFLLGVVCNVDKCINTLTIVSLVYVFLGVFYHNYVSFVIGTYEMNTNTDHMGMAYQYLPHVLLLLTASLKKFNILYFVGFILGLFMIVGSGNRGSLLLIAVFLMLYFVFGRGKNNTMTRAVMLLVLSAIILNIDSILVFLTNALDNFGLSNRSLRFYEEDFFNDNGRIKIQSDLIEVMWNSFFGYGLLGDRVINGDYGRYAHNFFIEVIISFGPFFGPLMIFACFILLFKAYRSCSSMDQRFFFFILLCCGLFKLFISASFMGEKFFYMLLGYSVAVIRDNKNKQILNESVERINSGRILGVRQTS